MDSSAKSGWIVALLLVVGCTSFLPGINWGLPSAAADRYLFGDQPVWPGGKIAALAGADGGNLGADVDLDPIAQRDRPVILNQTDAQRAQIIRRYRLYSYQPDEMITFRAISQFRPGQMQFDPKLYQYGGLWIYPVGAMLKVGSMLGLVDVRADLAYYLDHPDAFGRFYVVARLYSVLWGLVGIWAVYWIIGRFAGGLLLPVAGTLCFIFMPVVITMAHEAKPHLPGAVLVLLAVIAATKYTETGLARWWCVTGIAWGAAAGMIISALAAFAVIPAMVMMRPISWRARVKVLLAASAVGVAVYVLTNPYVPVRLIDEYVIGPEIGPLRSNLGNSAAMYPVGRWGTGVADALRLLAMGVSPVLMVAGVIGGAAVVARRIARRGDPGGPVCEGRGDVGWLLAAPAGLIMLQFTALAAGKPPEYARFAIVPDVALVVGAIAGAQALPGLLRGTVLALFVLFTGVHGSAYVTAFVNDARPRTSRIEAAEALAAMPGQSIGLSAEPAPYSCPPVDLFGRRLILMPEGEVGGDIHVRVEHLAGDADHIVPPRPEHKLGRLADLFPPAIGWADKQFLVEPAPDGR
jgi:hypothetical protein